MWKTVIYQGVIYDNLEINENGDLRNKTTELIYKSNPIGLGYNAVCISMGSRKNRKVIKNHKAVAETFIPNPNNYPCINHKDGNKLNNKIDNLEWCTYKQNTQHALKNNLIDLSKRAKENNSNAKLK